MGTIVKYAQIGWGQKKGRSRKKKSKQNIQKKNYTTILGRRGWAGICLKTGG